MIREDGSKRFLPFYRWIHWSFLLLAGIYYIPRKFSKNMENVKAKKLLEDLAHHACHYEKLDKDLMEKAARYVFLNLKTHNKLYVNYLTVNAIAMAVDISCMIYLDFLFQGRFMEYGIRAYPFNRDYDKFTDYMSQTFPPFANCELDEMNKLLDNRKETYGCHLTIMELYEKVFLLIWLWLIMLLFITSLYILFLLLMCVPKVRYFFLNVSKPVNRLDKMREVLNRACNNCKVGDIYLLYRIKQHLSDVRFYELLVHIGEMEIATKKPPPECFPDQIIIPPNPNQKQQIAHLRSRHDGSAKVPEYSPEYLKLLIPPNTPQNGKSKPSSPHTAPARNPAQKLQFGLDETSKKIPKGTSILIE